MDTAGKYVYASNWSHDSIAVFAIDESNGTLSKSRLFHQRVRNRAACKSIRQAIFYLLAIKSNRCVIFRIDPKTGKITPTGQAIEVSTPVAFQFVPAS